jgi:anti-sigma factor RsiW
MSTMLDAYIDGELEVAIAAQVGVHLGSCRACAANVEDRRALRDSVRQSGAYRVAPAPLRESVARELGRQRSQDAAGGARTPRWAWGSLAACLVLAGVVAWLLVVPRGAASAEDQILREAVSAHIRSLMATHLADIAVSDQHAVKPWFAGKLDFSPTVVDHAAEGFPLTGGRLDYVAGRPVAAVVYQRRAHVINLFTCPDTAAKASRPHSVQDRGFNAVTWSDGAMRFCAVSDVNKDDLLQFVSLVGLQDRPPAAPARGP